MNKCTCKQCYCVYAATTISPQNTRVVLSINLDAPLSARMVRTMAESNVRCTAQGERRDALRNKAKLLWSAGGTALRLENTAVCPNRFSIEVVKKN